MPLSKGAIKAAEDAVWNYFNRNLAMAYFSYRDYKNEVISNTQPRHCCPGDILEVDAPKSSAHTIDAIWVVYVKDDGEEILSVCLGQGRLNGWHAVAQVPTREHIHLSE